MKKIALVVGHNEKKKGAYSTHLNVSEYDFFSEVAKEIKKEIEVDIYTRKDVGSYSKEMQTVLNEIHKIKYDLVLELHFNAFNEHAEGVETLYYYKNQETKLLSEKLIKYHSEMLNLKKRKLIEIKDMSHNGSYGIMKCKYKYILTESFFGDNRSDCLKVENVKNLTRVFIEFLKNI